MNKLENIYRHVEILNEEVGKILIDMKWVKKIINYMAVILTGVLVPRNGIPSDSS